MNPILNLIEKWFTIFSLLFFTDLFRWSSLFVSGDPKATSTNDFNPFDPINSIFQYVPYAIALFFLIERKKTTISTARGNFLIWALPILAALSCLWSDLPDDSLRKGIVTIQITYFGLYFASRFSIKQQLQILAWVFGIIAIISLLFGIAFPGASVEMGEHAGAFRGPFIQKNTLARMAVLGSIVFLLNALQNMQSTKHKIIVWSGFLINVLLILLTTSKTALLLLLIILALLPFYKALRWKSTIVVPLIIMIIVCGGSILAIVLSNWEASLNSIGRDPSLTGRTGLWEAAIEKISERPWLGYGYQAFWQDDGGGAEIWRSEGYKPRHAHNGFINISLDLGLLSLFILLATIAINYVRAIAFLRSVTTITGLWPLSYITFFFMYNLTETTIFWYNSIFWILLVSTVFSVRQNNCHFLGNGQAIRDMNL